MRLHVGAATVLLSLAVGCGSSSPASPDAGGGEEGGHKMPMTDAAMSVDAHGSKAPPAPDAGAHVDALEEDARGGGDAPTAGDAMHESDASVGQDAAGGGDASSVADAGSVGEGGALIAASPMFGFTVNTTSEYPSASYGVQRFWDSPPFQWGTLQTAQCSDVATCAGGYDAANLTAFDNYLEKLKTNGVSEAWYTMARTPNFISSSPSDTNCNYTGAGQGGDGQCDRPTDLNADGTGTNLTFRKWYAFFAQRNNAASYAMSHAHIKYWEPWNEPDTQAFWGDGSGGHGSYDALIRLMQDTECLIVGTVGTGTITKTSETCAQVQASVGLTGPIDPTAIVVTPSYHAETASLSQFQNFLYCNNSPSVSCTSGDAGAKSVMVFNLHMKPGAGCVANAGGTSCTPATSVEPTYASYVKNFEGVLQSSELAAFKSGGLPLFDGEASYSPSGFIAPFTDTDMAASWIPRFFLYGRSLGVSANAWYTWDAIASNTKVVTAWNTLYQAWVGGTAPTCTNSGDVYTCSFTKAGASYEVLWDISQSCSAGTCTTSDQSVSSAWTKYRDLTGTAGTCVTACNVAGGSVPVGIKPVLLSH